MPIEFMTYHSFFREYYENGPINNRLRFGQAFCNKFNITDNELFYQEDAHVATCHIFKHYIRRVK